MPLTRSLPAPGTASTPPTPTPSPRIPSVPIAPLPSAPAIAAQEENDQANASASACEGTGHPQESEIIRWACVLAYFIIMFVTSGLLFAFGVIEAAMQAAHPDVSRSSIAALGAVSTGVVNISAVGSGLIIARFGETKTCILGGITAGLGLLLSSFAGQGWSLVASYGGTSVQRARGSDFYRRCNQCTSLV
jgi:hypothetical protein